MRPARSKKTLGTAFAADIQAEIEALLSRCPDAALDLEAVETAARRCALQLAALAVQDRLNADGSDWQGPRLRCACGESARYAGRRAKTFLSALGPIELRRAYYHCPACKAGFFPRDQSLGLAGTSLSPATTRMLGTAAACVSFAEASALLDELAGLRISPKQVERSAEALGREIAADEQARVETVPPPAPTMYLGLDGTGVPVRKQETAGRPGKQPDGSAKTREVKLVTVWTAESLHPKTGRPQRDPGSVTYSAAVESAASLDTDPQPSPFARRVRREAERRGFPHATRRVVLGDGAPWIWRLATEILPGAIQIVDLFHAKQHLSDVAKAIHGPGSARAEAWADTRHDELDAGCIDAVLAALRQHADNSEEARKCAEYVATNQERMRYEKFRAAGLCVGSGVVEAGCKVTVGTRLKRAGMHWSVDGANDILALRCCHLSGRIEDFWAYRSEAI